MVSMIKQAAITEKNYFEINKALFCLAHFESRIGFTASLYLCVAGCQAEFDSSWIRQTATGSPGQYDCVRDGICLNIKSNGRYSAIQVGNRSRDRLFATI